MFFSLLQRKYFFFYTYLFMLFLTLFFYSYINALCQHFTYFVYIVLQKKIYVTRSLVLQKLFVVNLQKTYYVIIRFEKVFRLKIRYTFSLTFANKLRS